MSAGTKVVLITGASGGLGSALVAEFRRQGWHVAAGFHHQPLIAADDGILPVPLDVTDRASAAQAMDAVLTRWNRVDVLINNAGVTADALLAQMTEAAWDRALDVNLKGAFLCSQMVSRQMMKQRDGHIINVTSFVGRVGRAGQANYAASKAGINALIVGPRYPIIGTSA